MADRETRADDLALIEDCHGANPFTDELLLSRVFRRLGWAMLTDEAVELLAAGYEAEQRSRERINAENRALRERAF